MNSLIKPQPPPHQNNGGNIVADMVIADMKARKEFGIAKYGVFLKSNNGRNNLIDSYQEILDLCVYLRSEIETNWIEPDELW